MILAPRRKREGRKRKREWRRGGRVSQGLACLELISSSGSSQGVISSPQCPSALPSVECPPFGLPLPHLPRQAAHVAAVAAPLAVPVEFLPAVL